MSFGKEPVIAREGEYMFFAGARSDAFFFDFDGIKNLFDITGGRNFTAPHLGSESPWTGVDSDTEANVMAFVLELRPPCWALPRTSGSGGVAAACAATANLCTWTGPGTRR